MAKSIQTRNGKAFEYALAKVYHEFICKRGLLVKIIDNEAFKNAKISYESCKDEEKLRFDRAAFGTLDTMMKIEPGFLAQKDDHDVLSIILQKDKEGEIGDVRDIIFRRETSKWEVGFSAKNNNDAVKNSRLSKNLDFGKKWLGYPCSETYWNEITPLFDKLGILHKENPDAKWNDLVDSKMDEYYVPVLTAFKKELLKINSCNKEVPGKLILYLIGNQPFYKIIKDDNHNLVIVKAFNIFGTLNKPVNGVKSLYSAPKINLPTRIVEFEFMQGKKDTLDMILDGGWEISFRIHSAKSNIQASLKFDVRLIGNPPVLFTQHLFQ